MWRLRLLVILSAGMLAGCTDQTVGIVSGTINVDGAPAETGSIVFVPVDGLTAPVGGTVEDGKYELELPIGQAKVEIRVPKVVGQTKIYNTPDSPVQDVMQESLPTKYNDQSELTYDVPGGKSTKDFDLESRPLKKSRR